jgi:hypothetical protein
MSEFLKCDAPGCDHFEITAITIDVVDKPCPKCGANLCTKEDFVLFKSLSAASDAASAVILRDDPGAEIELVATNVHNGKIKIAAAKSETENPFPNEGRAP